ncbi:Transcriptional regulatory protein sin3 [Irineochytrium annulatum]|nr:Transcriptional regulatory protein sin3 [Irineochytrium annulatum]
MMIHPLKDVPVPQSEGRRVFSDLVAGAPHATPTASHHVPQGNAGLSGQPGAPVQVPVGAPPLAGPPPYHQQHQQAPLPPPPSAIPANPPSIMLPPIQHGQPVALPPIQHPAAVPQQQQQPPLMQPPQVAPPQAPMQITNAPMTITNANPLAAVAQPIGVAQQAPPQQAAGPVYPETSFRPLNVSDALTYLDQVKIQFQDFPHVYNQFLDIMKDFKSQAIDTPGVIERVSNLFRGYPALINGFNTFLPPGYRLEAPLHPNDPVRVTTPQSSAAAGHDYNGHSGSGHISVYYTNVNPQGGPGGPGAGGPPVYVPPMQGGAAGSTHSPPFGHSQAHPMGGVQATGGAQMPPQAPPSHSGFVSSARAGPTAMPAAPTPMQVAPAAPAQPAAGQTAAKPPVEFNHAINYVNKIRNRFAAEPESYKQFLEILQTYQKDQKPIQEVYSSVSVLFKNAPDLLDEFKQFLPDTSAKPAPVSKMPPVGNFPTERRGSNGPPTLPSKKSNKRAAGGASAPPMGPSPTVPAASTSGSGMNASRKRGTKTSASAGIGGSNDRLGAVGAAANAALPKPEIIEELDWIDRCKRTINNRTVFNEFLKVLNLYSQCILDAKTLVDRIEPFLSRSPELFLWFKGFVKYEEDVTVQNIPAERPLIDMKTCRKHGHSYRLLPAEIPRPVCSGRDALAREVLNDDWVSQQGDVVSETGTFVAHKKTQFEEALHKCEEERYEFDINIEANLHTIALLEPIHHKIQSMTLEEKSKFKLPVGLGGESTTIYQRVIKKIYDKEKGQEVIEALHNNPSVAVPVVLRRLKQKDDEWKRTQRDWNKIWREIDLRNHYKALDHQGITFKANDKKTVSGKSLICEIEDLYREQRERRSVLSAAASSSAHHHHLLAILNGTAPNAAPLTRYQMEFRFHDPEVFRDCRKMILMMVAYTGSISQGDEDRIAEFLTTFIRKFFLVETYDDGRDDLDVDDDVDDGADEDGMELENDGSEKEIKVENGDETPERPVGNTEPDLLRGAIAKSAGMKGGGLVGDANGDAMDTDDEFASEGAAKKNLGVKAADSATHMKVGSPRKRRSSYAMYGNSTYYIFFRLYQLLYSRLLKMKEIANHLNDGPAPASRLNVTAVELGLQNPYSYASDAIIPQKKDRYQELIRTVNEFFQQKQEAAEFEDRCRSLFGTSGFLMFTIDKVVQAIIKQIQVIQGDQRNMELCELYFKDRDKKSSSARQEAIYRLNAEGLTVDEHLYRMEYHVREQALTIQLLSKDDAPIDDPISSEEKWSLYVDHFIQLSATPTMPILPSRPSYYGVPRPFLQRSLPPDTKKAAPEGSETRSGLELKICLNTYKIFFVENTEDYYIRRKRGGEWEEAGRVKRFRDWVEERMKRHEDGAELDGDDEDGDDDESNDDDDDAEDGDGDLAEERTPEVMELDEGMRSVQEPASEVVKVEHNAGLPSTAAPSGAEHAPALQTASGAPKEEPPEAPQEVLIGEGEVEMQDVVKADKEAV